MRTHRAAREKTLWTRLSASAERCSAAEDGRQQELLECAVESRVIEVHTLSPGHECALNPGHQLVLGNVGAEQALITSPVDQRLQRAGNRLVYVRLAGERLRQFN